LYHARTPSRAPCSTPLPSSPSVGFYTTGTPGRTRNNRGNNKPTKAQHSTTQKQVRAHSGSCWRFQSPLLVRWSLASFNWARNYAQQLYRDGRRCWRRRSRTARVASRPRAWHSPRIHLDRRCVGRDAIHEPRTAASGRRYRGGGAGAGIRLRLRVGRRAGRGTTNRAFGRRGHRGVHANSPQSERRGHSGRFARADVHAAYSREDVPRQGRPAAGLAITPAQGICASTGSC
jgi:hypothetical protein